MGIFQTVDPKSATPFLSHPPSNNLSQFLSHRKSTAGNSAEIKQPANIEQKWYLQAKLWKFYLTMGSGKHNTVGTEADLRIPETLNEPRQIWTFARNSWQWLQLSVVLSGIGEAVQEVKQLTEMFHMYISFR